MELHRHVFGLRAYYQNHDGDFVSGISELQIVDSRTCTVVLRYASFACYLLALRRSSLLHLVRVVSRWLLLLRGTLPQWIRCRLKTRSGDGP